MKEILMAVMSPLIAGIIGFAVFAVFRLPVNRYLFKKFIPENKPDILKALVTFLTAAISVAVLLAVSAVLTGKFTEVERHISVWACSAVSCLGTAAAAFYMTDSKKMFSVFGKIFIAAAVLFVCEVFVFNMKSFGTDFQKESLILKDAEISGECEFTDEGIVAKEYCEIIFNDPPAYTKGLIFDISQEESIRSTIFEITAAIKDKNFTGQFNLAQDKFTMGYGRPLTMTVNPYKELCGLKLCLGSIDKPVTIKGITAVSKLPFAFSLVRFFALLAIAAIAVIIKELKLYKISLNSGSIKHSIILQAAALLMTMSALLFNVPGQEVFEYDSPAGVGISDPYSMTFDAMMKDQPYLDLEADEKLAELENPYDITQRTDNSVFYHWDYAYYNGHYYCYFGVTPVLAFYYPFYLATGKVPTMEMASLFFGMLAVFFFCQAFIALCKRFLPKINLLLMLLVMAAGVSCAGMYTCMNQVNKYNLPIAAGMCFLMLCLWMGTAACSCESKPLRIIMLLLSGTSLAFCAAARPGMTLCSLILVPLFIGLLTEKNRSRIFKAAETSGFLIPAAIGAVLIMRYNMLRFGSPFDFGAAYQLTVSDVHANKLQLSGIFPAIYHYFFQIPRFRPSFPFFEPQFVSLNNYTKYTYVDSALGAFSYPLIALGMIFLPLMLKRKSALQSDREMQLRRKWVMLIGIVVALFMAWQEFCMAGIIDRYVLDILPLLTLIAGTGVLFAAGQSDGFGIRYKAGAASAIATLCISWLLIIGRRGGTISMHFPDLYDAAEDLLIFWQ